jgi:hypothetical protein
MTKEEEIMGFLYRKIFNPILKSPIAPDALKRGIRLTIMRLNERDAQGMILYFWSAVVGTEKSTRFAKLMKDNGFVRFEEVIHEFRARFNSKWLNS